MKIFAQLRIIDQGGGGVQRILLRLCYIGKEGEGGGVNIVKKSVTKFMDSSLDENQSCESTDFLRFEKITHSYKANILVKTHGRKFDL